MHFTFEIKWTQHPQLAIAGKIWAVLYTSPGFFPLSDYLSEFKHSYQATENVYFWLFSTGKCIFDESQI